MKFDLFLTESDDFDEAGEQHPPISSRDLPYDDPLLERQRRAGNLSRLQRFWNDLMLILGVR